jgi:hypothetical protein
VEVCDAGIALAHQLGSPPVQYPSIKALALVDLGRFDEAWASLQEEVADEDHAFGYCMQQLAVAFWFERAGALDRAEERARWVLEEAARLSRTWMQSNMVDLLGVIAARRGDAGHELTKWLDGKCTEIGFHLSRLPQAELALARGDTEEGRRIAREVAEGGGLQGLRRRRLVAAETELRALAELERWDELLERADAAIEEADAAGYDLLIWRMRGLRALGRDAAGDTAGAAEDRKRARTVLLQIAGTVPREVLV